LLKLIATASLFTIDFFLGFQGTVKQRNFGEVKFKVCPTEKLGREFLKSRGVEHYWDLAYSGCVLDNADDIF
jgi:U4/U6 small nuclear ribonucleoprotein PRP3